MKNTIRNVLSTGLLVLEAVGTASAAIVTHGYLTSDDSTNFITDTITRRQYLRFDTFNLSVADTIAATGIGGDFEGWNIADRDIVGEFYSSILGLNGSLQCSRVCGNITGYNDGDFGDSYNINHDLFWYLSNQPGSRPYGLATIYDGTGLIDDQSSWAYANTIDDFGGSKYPTLEINALLYREAVVPIPAAAWLFGSGLIGLAGFARRNK